MIKALVLLFCTFAAASAADFLGTWKLNPTKSKYEGVPAPKEQTVTYTAKGTGYEYAAKGTNAAGQPTTLGFTYVKDGEEIRVMGSHFWDAMVLKNGMGTKTAGTTMRGGKKVGTVSRTLSADGKTLTVAAKVTLADGTKASYSAVHDRQ